MKITVETRVLKGGYVLDNFSVSYGITGESQHPQTQVKVCRKRALRAMVRQLIAELKAI